METKVQILYQEKFENGKWIIRRRKLKTEGQYYGKKTNYHRQNDTQKTGI